MYGRLEEGGMVVAGRAAGRRRREVKERGTSGLCGHGWCVWEEAGGGRREGKGGVGDTGFVLHDAYLKNLFCCCLS